MTIYGHFSAANGQSLAFYCVIFIHNLIVKTLAMKNADIHNNNMLTHFIISSEKPVKMVKSVELVRAVMRLEHYG